VVLKYLSLWGTASTSRGEGSWARWLAHLRSVFLALFLVFPDLMTYVNPRHQVHGPLRHQLDHHGEMHPLFFPDGVFCLW
jgi:hypothetical protein